MSEKKLLLSEDEIIKIANKYGTPFNIYSKKLIKDNAKKFKNAFSWNEGWTNYFAVKALPNINILKIMKDLDFGLDCSSIVELKLAKMAGFAGEKIMFSSNNTSEEEFRLAFELGAIINLDDISHIDKLKKAINTFPETISFRYNPGSDRVGNSIIGNPVEAKYGVTKDQIVSAYKKAKEFGAKHFYLHTMVASNELKREYIVQTAKMLFDLVKRIKDEADIKIEKIDLGGGIGIPYRPEDEDMDLALLGDEIHSLYDNMIVANSLQDIKLCFECGRMITGPYGQLVAKVQNISHKYKTYVGLDACMSDLMRPALYGAYHHISVLNSKDRALVKYDVTGSLCENNDKFAIDRELPELTEGDIIVIHDTGAHGTAMGFNYNGRLWHKELLIRENGNIEIIRRDESFYDYISTMLFKPEKINF